MKINWAKVIDASVVWFIIPVFTLFSFRILNSGIFNDNVTLLEFAIHVLFCGVGFGGGAAISEILHQTIDQISSNKNNKNNNE